MPWFEYGGGLSKESANKYQESRKLLIVAFNVGRKEWQARFVPVYHDLQSAYLFGEIVPREFAEYLFPRQKNHRSYTTRRVTKRHAITNVLQGAGIPYETPAWVATEEVTC